MKNTYELYHHGILGQKWGKRNGPPYPLGVSDHSLAEKKAGWRNSLNNEGRPSKKTIKNISKLSRKGQKDINKKAKRQLREDTMDKVSEFVHSKGFQKGMKIALVLAATYGASKLGEKYLKDWGIKYYQESYNSLPSKFYKLSDVPKASSDYLNDYLNNPSEYACDNLVRGINHGVNAENYLVSPGRNQNCTFCSAAIIMRLKGYEASAAEIMHGLPKEIVAEWYNGAKFEIPKIKNSKGLYEHLLQQGDGHYGTLHITYKAGGMHSIVYIVKNGAVELLDGQLSATYGNSYEDLKTMLDLCKISATEICDLTNCTPTERILKALT